MLSQLAEIIPTLASGVQRSVADPVQVRAQRLFLRPDLRQRSSGLRPRPVEQILNLLIGREWLREQRSGPAPAPRLKRRSSLQSALLRLLDLIDVRLQ